MGKSVKIGAPPASAGAKTGHDKNEEKKKKNGERLNDKIQRKQ